MGGSSVVTLAQVWPEPPNHGDACPAASLEDRIRAAGRARRDSAGPAPSSPGALEQPGGQTRASTPGLETGAAQTEALSSQCFRSLKAQED